MRISSALCRLAGVALADPASWVVRLCLGGLGSRWLDPAGMALVAARCGAPSRIERRQPRQRPRTSVSARHAQLPNESRVRLPEGQRRSCSGRWVGPPLLPSRAKRGPPGRFKASGSLTPGLPRPLGSAFKAAPHRDAPIAAPWLAASPPHPLASSLPFRPKSIARNAAPDSLHMWLPEVPALRFLRLVALA